MKTMEKVSRNNKKTKNLYLLLQQAGRGVKMAADTGYKTGYFMAKHPGIETTKKSIQKNYKPILLGMVGFVIGVMSILKVFMKHEKA